MPQRLYALLDQLLGLSPVARKLRRDFRDDPSAVTQQLDSAARAELYSMSRSNISGYVYVEFSKDFPNEQQLYADWDKAFRAWSFPVSEFPRKDLPPACQGQDGEQPQYPDPEPRVYRISPSFVQAGSASPLAIEVVGQGFVKGTTTLALVSAAGHAPLVVANQKFGGTFRCGHLHADVTVPAAVSVPGVTDVYNVEVIVDAGDAANPKPVVVPSAVTFEVRP